MKEKEIVVDNDGNSSPGQVSSPPSRDFGEDIGFIRANVMDPKVGGDAKETVFSNV